MPEYVVVVLPQAKVGHGGIAMWTISQKFEIDLSHIKCTCLIFVVVQDQITQDLYPGEEEEESSADDLTPSVTSNTSDLLRRLQGNTQRRTH